MIKRIGTLQDSWFYSNPHPFLRLLTIYVKGDMLIILPFFVLIGLVGLWSVRFMLLIYAIFYSVRGLGEMIYWIGQQFSVKTYRPYDFGLTKLSNDAIYILYQVASMTTVVVGLSAAAWIVLYMY